MSAAGGASGVVGWWRDEETGLNRAQMAVVRTLAFAIRTASRGRLRAKTVVVSSAGSVFGNHGRGMPATFEQLAANKSWAYAANRQIAGRAARVEPLLEMVQRQRDAAARRAPVHDHPILDLLAQPNRGESGKVFLWRTVLQLQTAGRAYVLVEPEAIDLSPIGLTGLVISRIESLRLLEPDRVRPGFNDKGDTLAFEYSSPRGKAVVYPHAPATYQEREAWRRKPYAFVYRVAMPDSLSPDGASPLQAGADAVNMNAGIKQLHWNQLTNGVHAGLVYFLKGVAGGDQKRFEEAVKMLKAGIGHAGEPSVFNHGQVEVQKAPASLSEIPFIELAGLSRDEILAVLGGSAGTIGLVKDVNRASIEGLERIIALGTVDPMTGLIADATNAWLLPLYTGQSDRAWYELSYPSSAIADEVTQAERLMKLTGGKPIYTQNEARAELGKKAHIDGDDLDPMQALTGAGAGVGLSLGSPGGAPGQSAAHAATHAATHAGPASQVPADMREGARVTSGAQTPAASSTRADGSATSVRLASGHALHTEEARASKWAARRELRRAHESALRKAVAGVFRQWREAFVQTLEAKGADVLLGQLPRQRAGKGQRDDLLDPLAAEAWEAAFAAAYAPWARKLQRAILTDLAGDLAVDPAVFSEASVKLAQWTEQRSGTFARQVVATQQDFLERALSSAIADGVGPSDLVDSAPGLFPKANDYRAHLIATTEATNGIGATNADAIDQYLSYGEPDDATESTVTGGPRLGLMWLSRRDNVVRDDHANADGQVVARGEAFTVGGSQLRWPGDTELGADIGQIANCRCESLVVPLEGNE